MSLSKLVEISNLYGKNLDYVLAGGGNTSFKDKDYIYIKASGTTLGEIDENGFVKMRRDELQKMWTKKYSSDDDIREKEVLEDLLRAREFGENGRPSVETSLHELLPQSYVIHIHPALLNGLSCSKDGEKLCKKLLGEDVIWVPIVKPGWVLATEVKKASDEYTKKSGKIPQKIVLQNHGIFIGDDDIDNVKKMYNDVFMALRVALTKDIDHSEVEFDRKKAANIAPVIRMMLREDSTSIVAFKTNADIMNFVKDEKSFYPISSAFSPDHIVYCKSFPLFVKSVDDIDAQHDILIKAIEEYKIKYGYLPRMIAVQGLGIFSHGTTKKNADTAMTLFMDTCKIGVYTQSFGGVQFMPADLIDFIANWEVEHYRQKVLNTVNAKRLAEKITIVTGAAQGFGQGIADEMLKHGSNMVIADLNIELAEKNVAEINKIYGAGKAIAVKVDVSNEDAVEQMVFETVLAYGGLDVIVCNAGISRPGSLEEMNEKLFDLMTDVNYKAYYFCTKHASRIMKIQNKIDKNYYTDILQINSKSGLTGSNKNFGYAGSKFGGIGLTQSFALELVEYKVKVNSICPGNYFDGPLWGDPEKGLFVQYLNAKKAPGAKTVEDVKKFYEAKIPMTRGCLPVDVARAIMYCIEQEYETGQAIPVSGGQTMLK